MSKPGLRQAINNFCRDCIFDKGFEGGGTWRQQITDCTAEACPLYQVRPLTAAAQKAVPKKPRTEKQKAALAKARAATETRDGEQK